MDKQTCPLSTKPTEKPTGNGGIPAETRRKRGYPTGNRPTGGDNAGQGAFAFRETGMAGREPAKRNKRNGGNAAKPDGAKAQNGKREKI
jgi:hypothetical protein